MTIHGWQMTEEGKKERDGERYASGKNDMSDCIFKEIVHPKRKIM